MDINIFIQRTPSRCIPRFEIVKLLCIIYLLTSFTQIYWNIYFCKKISMLARNLLLHAFCNSTVSWCQR